jgi:hypothetical protein
MTKYRNITQEEREAWNIPSGVRIKVVDEEDWNWVCPSCGKKLLLPSISQGYRFVVNCGCWYKREDE